MPLRLLIAFALTACHQDSIAHPDIPPLPPASGTPVGYIVEAASDLHLTDAQVSTLKQIDTDLSSQLDALDKKQRVAAKPGDGSGSSAPPPMSGHRRGMMQVGGGGRRGGGGKRRTGAGSGSGAPTVDAVTSQRNTLVREALGRALALLDAGQKTEATKILADRGVDMDPDHPIQSDEDAAGSDEP